jgi:hypothetical protein
VPDRFFYVALCTPQRFALRDPSSTRSHQGQKPAGAKACVSSFSSLLSIGGSFETDRDGFAGSDALTRAALGITAAWREARKERGAEFCP